MRSADVMQAVFLLGPTASGKSAAAFALAESVPLELVSVDSAQVYRGMDIGTAKPSAQERAAVPHHLIDLIDPTDAYSAARFVADTHALIAQINARGRLALLVGGTMLYARALRTGLDDLPRADPRLRASLDAEALRVGWPALHARLARVDPVTAARLPPTDSQRIQRALEVFELAGRPMSVLLGNQGAAPAPIPCVALEPSIRADLHERIALRFDRMLAAGLCEELAGLRQRFVLHAGLPSMRCVGYRQAWEHLEGHIGAAALREQGIAATRQLAKRQLTWLRSMPERIVIDCLAPDANTQVRHAVTNLMQHTSRAGEKQA